MSEGITHTAVVDDCFRLASASDSFCPLFREVAREHHDVARLGGITRQGDRFTVQLLTQYRAEHEAGGLDDATRAKLAFVLGWLCHRAADRQMKPVFRALDPGCPRKPTDCSVYHDAFLFREMYAGGGGPFTAETFDDAELPGEALDVRAVEELFQALLQRALLQMHTFIPDLDDADGWLDRVVSTRQRFYLDLGRYARAIASPDPDLVHRFITEPNFYDAGEPILAAAKRLRLGKVVSAVDVGTALDAEAASEYAQAVRKGCAYLRAASAFWRGELSSDVLREQFDIGKPGRDGRPV